MYNHTMFLNQEKKMIKHHADVPCLQLFCFRSLDVGSIMQNSAKKNYYKTQVLFFWRLTYLFTNYDLLMSLFLFIYIPGNKVFVFYLLLWIAKRLLSYSIMLTCMNWDKKNSNWDDKPSDIMLHRNNKHHLSYTLTNVGTYVHLRTK